MYNELKQEIFAKESSVNSFNKELERTIGEIKQEIENVDVERKEVYNKLELTKKYKSVFSNIVPIFKDDETLQFFPFFKNTI